MYLDISQIACICQYMDIKNMALDQDGIQGLLRSLRRLSGQKRIVLFFPEEAPGSFDMQGEDRDQDNKITTAMLKLRGSTAGSLLVRHETGLSTISQVGSITTKVPQYRIYGAFISNDILIPVPVGILKRCYETDPASGGFLNKGNGVHFSCLSGLLAKVAA